MLHIIRQVIFGLHTDKRYLTIVFPLRQESKDLQPLVGEWIDHQIPTRTLAEVTDLQAAIVFMASPASNYMVFPLPPRAPFFLNEASGYILAADA